ncbi:hypothetical protein ACSLVK_13240 [Photorhabdus tasmaniensis]|uniref:hypothetical protein n=1 Tax=Photorhabdus tasmaniensis TaxID=1004159 RepID=UPI0040417B68
MMIFQLPTLAGKKLRDILRKNNHDEVLDFTCRRGRFEFRVIRRSLARRFLPSISFLKAAKNVDVWLLPILGAIIHHAGSEIDLKFKSTN